MTARVKRVELVSEFTAVSESGTRYGLRLYQDIIDAASHGRSVNRIAKGQYRIVGHPDIVVTSTDPVAP